jgi:ComF family protein
MADRLNDLIQRDLEEPEPYSYATSLFYYRASTGYRDITKGLKYKGDISSGRFFSRMLAEEIAGSVLYSDVDTVIPVPLHWTRRWSRGYNQAEVIGETIAMRLGALFRRDILKRHRRTKTQTKISIERKEANVSDAFRLKKGADLSGCRHILLVDDVFTTGATVNSCSKALRGLVDSGVRISVATLACVGD